MRRGMLARHPELTGHAQHLATTGAWRRWQAIDDRLSTFASLEEAAHTWRTERSVPCYPVVAALAHLGSRRGADDDDAAIAVLVMLEVDIDLLTARVSRNCEPDDVVWAVWDAVKRAEPHLGCRAPYFLIRRAKKRLLTDFRTDGP